MRLYGKLFVLLLTILLATALLSLLLERRLAGEERQIDTALTQMSRDGETAAALYTNEGEHALRRWLHRELAPPMRRGMLLASDGSSLSAWPHARFGLPPQVQAVVGKAVASGERTVAIEPPLLILAMPVRHGEQRYLWVATTLLPPKQPPFGSPLLHLTLLLLAVALTAALLTRLFARPIARLVATTDRIGGGDLAARTPSDLVARKDELGSLAASIDAMVGQLQQQLEGQRQLLRAVSHELRSPLARLQLSLALAHEAAGKAAGDALQGELARIGREAQRLDALIGEVLSYARLEQGEMALAQQEIRLDALLTEVAEAARIEADAGGQRLELDLAACTTVGDPLWLGRAFDNLLRNALRHSPAGGSIAIVLRLCGTGVEIGVADRGEGVPEAQLGRIFDPFCRLDAARDPAAGHGLGLAIVKGVVERHGGKVWAENRPQGGLRVVARLPEHRAGGLARGDKAAAAGENGGGR